MLVWLIALSFLTAAVPADSTDWQPPSPYWERYGTVFTKNTYDSTGTLKHTDLLCSYASPAETDSILELARTIQVDPETQDGRVLTARLEENAESRDNTFILPFMTHRGTVSPSLPASRADLERAGIGSWLKIWDNLLPQWPFETWSSSSRSRMYPYPPGTEVSDSEFLARDMISTSPNGVWRLHPFYDVHFGPKDEIGLEVDSGFILYRTKPPRDGRQWVCGTTVNLWSAEWIDDKRFVVTGDAEEHLSYGDKWADFRKPVMYFGNVDSLHLTVLTGPPIPVPEATKMRRSMVSFITQRYPKYGPSRYPSSVK